MSSRIRTRTLVSAFILVPLVLVASGCEKKVQVRTGERVTCTYGHVIVDSVKTKEVSASEVSKYRVKERTETCEDHLEAEKLYAEAQAAITAGDLKGAAAKLQQVVEIDEAFARAGTQLADIEAGKKPVADTVPPSSSVPTTGTTKPPTDATPAGSLEKYIPDALTGFTAREAMTDAMSVSRMYVPAAGSKMMLLTVVAEQYRTDDEAKAALASLKTSYSGDTGKVTAGGKDAYFGTDGSDAAVVAFTDGPTLVVFEGVARAKVEAKALSSELSAAAGQVR